MKTLHRFSLLVVLLLGFTGFQRVHAQGLGVTAGLNFNSLSDIEAADREATFDNATGWHVGVWFDLPLGLLAVRPGIRYMDAGDFAAESDLGLPFPDLDVSMVEIPIDLRFRFGPPMLTPYVLAGPVLRFPSGDEDERLESFSYAANIGVGIEVNLVGIRLLPELKYTFGISRFTSEEFEIGGTRFQVDEEGQLNTIMLSLGVGL